MNYLTDVTEKAQRFLSYFSFFIKKSDYSNNYYIVVNNSGKIFGKFLYKRDQNNILYFKLDFVSNYGNVIAYIRRDTNHKKNLEIHFKIKNDTEKKYITGVMKLSDFHKTYTTKKNPCSLVLEESKLINGKLYPYRKINIDYDGIISFYNLLKDTGVDINKKENKLTYYIGKNKKLQISQTFDNNVSIEAKNIIINEKFDNSKKFYEICFDILPDILDFISDEIISFNEDNCNFVLDILLENIKENKDLKNIIKSTNKKKILD